MSWFSQTDQQGLLKRSWLHYFFWFSKRGLFMFSLTLQAQPLMIAHAGGGINGMNYSNSIEALEANYAKGFRVFEIDFSWTRDGQLVCLHDWRKRFKKVFGVKIKQALTYQQFQHYLDETQGVHPCTPKSLASWLQKHTDAKIITDVKHNNIRAIKKLKAQFPHMVEHFIVQFYQPEEYAILKNMGFSQLIWILYQYKGSKKSVVHAAKQMDLVAVSMNRSLVKSTTLQKLIAAGHKIFVYTINKHKKVKLLQNKYHVSGIYTDFLNP